MKISFVITIIFVIIIISYGVFRANTIIFGPSVTVYFPEPHSTQPQEFTLDGMVKDVSYLTVNDQRVLPTRDGLFKKKLLLPVGYNVVEVYALSRQKRETIIHLPLYIKEHDNKKN